MKDEMQQMVTSILLATRQEPNQDLLAEIKKLKEENEELKSRKRGRK